MSWKETDGLSCGDCLILESEMERISIFSDYSRVIACCSVLFARSTANHVLFYTTLPRIYHSVFQQRRSVMFGTQRLPLTFFIITQSLWIRFCYFPAFHVKDRILFSFPPPPPLATVTVRCLYEISGPCGGSCLGHLSLQPPGGGGERTQRTANQGERRREESHRRCTMTFLIVL